MRDKPHTPPETLTRAGAIARANGIRYAYTGNVHDPAAAPGATTAARADRARLVPLGTGGSPAMAAATSAARPCPASSRPPGTWGPRRQPVRIANQ